MMNNTNTRFRAVAAHDRGRTLGYYSGLERACRMYKKLLRVARSYERGTFGGHETERLTMTLAELEAELDAAHFSLIEVANAAGYDGPDEFNFDLACYVGWEMMK
jgi:hypothetical protein